jgi:MoaA/NifB/PqqE/SkfB family radical SAM enzyme
MNTRLSRQITILKRIFFPNTQMPVFIMMFVTNRCDARCRHCFYWQSLNKHTHDELTLDEIEALARSIGPIMQITLTGGSPELREDLPEVARSFSRHCQPANMTICMNGYHTQRILAQVEEILRTCPKQRLSIGLSLDGIGQEHDEIRGLPGLFEHVIETYSGLKKLKAEYPQLNINCGICISELNYPNAEKTVQWIQENLPIDQLKITLVRGQPDPRDSRVLGQGCVKGYLDLISKRDIGLSGKPNIRLSLTDLFSRAKEMVVRDLINEIIQTNRSPVRCSATRQNALIYPNGIVGGCEMRAEELGNLRDHEMDLSKLWNAAPAREFRKRVKDEHCVCYHHGFLSIQVFRSPILWPRLALALLKIRKTQRAG